MPFKGELFDYIRSFGGIGLVSFGVLWECLYEPGLIGWMIIGFGLAIQLLTERSQFRRTLLDWPILLLVITGGVSLCVTASIELTAVQVTRLGASLVFFYSLVFWANRRERLLLTAKLLMISGSFLTILAPFIVDWNESKGIPIPGVIYNVFPTLVSDVVHPNIIATLLVLLFPISLANLISYNLTTIRKPINLFKVLTTMLACGLMVFTLILTKSRGGYLAAGVGGITVIWILKGRNWALGLTIPLSVLGVWILASLNHVSSEMIEGISDPRTWTFRKEVWLVALWMISEFPFTGVGMGTFNDVATRLYPFPMVSNPGTHNLYLQVATDLGVLGLIAFLSIILLAVMAGVIAIRKLAKDEDKTLKSYVVGALAGIIGLIIHGLVDNGAWGVRATFIPWLVIGFIIAVYVNTHVTKYGG